MFFFFSVVGMCEFIFSARGWLTHGFGLSLDAGLVDRYVDHVVELVRVGISERKLPRTRGNIHSLG